MTETLLGDPERLRKVADVIEEHPEHFDMGYWVVTGGEWLGDVTAIATTDLFSCGTRACIAGWACNLWAAEVNPVGSPTGEAARILGLDYETAQALFKDGPEETATAENAAAHLRAMADRADPFAEARALDQQARDIAAEATA